MGIKAVTFTFQDCEFRGLESDLFSRWLARNDLPAYRRLPNEPMINGHALLMTSVRLEPVKRDHLVYERKFSFNVRTGWILSHTRCSSLRHKYREVFGESS